MNVKINSVKFKADRKLEDFINERIGKLTTYYDGLISSEVTLKIDNVEGPDNKITEIRLVIKGNDLYARKQSKSFEESTDTAVEALRKQLKKHKEKMRRF